MGGEEKGTKKCLSKDISQVSGKPMNRHVSGTRPWLDLFCSKNGQQDIVQRIGIYSVKAFWVFRQDTYFAVLCAHTCTHIWGGARRERTSCGISFTICWVLTAICKVKAFMLFSLCSKCIFLSQWLLALSCTTRRDIQQFGASRIKHWQLRNLKHPVYTVIWQKVLPSCLL